MNIGSSTGKLIAIDMYSCSYNILKDHSAVEEVLDKACRDFAMHVSQVLYYEEDEQNEYTLFAACSQGHVTLHIYPDVGFVTADIFSCSEGADPAGMARFLRSYFDADKSKITLLDRGDFGTKNDMKPKRRSKITFIRRTKNLGGRLKKIILRPRSN